VKHAIAKYYWLRLLSVLFAAHSSQFHMHGLDNLGMEISVLRIRDPVLFFPRIRDGAMVGSGSG
jgi:hypothetical protein